MPPADPSIPDIQDIVIPDPLPNYWPLILGLGIGMLILALLALAAFYLFRYLRSRQGKIDPREVARERLHALGRNGGQLSPNEFSLQVSETLKDYLSERYGDPLRYETSEEFLDRLSEARTGHLPLSLCKKLAQFARISDELKFGLPPDAEARKAPLLAQAWEILSDDRNADNSRQ